MVGPLHPVSNWLVEHGEARSVEALLGGLFDRLRDAGVPLWRCATSVPTLHPEVYVRNVVLVRGAPCEVHLRTRALMDLPLYKDSPVRAIHEGGGPMRLRLGDAGATRYPIVRELAEQGGTDYLITPIAFADGRRTYISWATDAPEGFSDANLALLQEIVPLFAIRLELEAAYFATRSLLEVYLGGSAASRVLAGAFHRGGGERITAAIWYCDLRGFTTSVDQEPIEDVLALLDRYFECTAGAVIDSGGEVLKFIGDAVLAIFPADDEAGAPACAKALAAAEAALASMQVLNGERSAAGKSAVGLGIALHFGEVMYGNIGARKRLDFTVVGAAVNEASRIESLCKPLGVPLLMSAGFGSKCGADVVTAGRHALKGVAQPQELLTLRHLISV